MFGAKLRFTVLPLPVIILALFWRVSQKGSSLMRTRFILWSILLLTLSGCSWGEGVLNGLVGENQTLQGKTDAGSINSMQGGYDRNKDLTP